MAHDLFSKGCLVQLETSAWTAQIKIPSRALLANGDHADVDPAFVGASKKLVDSKALKDLHAIRGEARTWLYSRSLPFPLDGLVFVPVDAIESIDAKLVEFRARFEAAADTFAADYAALRSQARAKLGSLYSDADYPADVRRKFAFGWRFISLAPPGEHVLSPALVAQERAKFQALMADAAEAATTELRVRFATCVDHMVDRLTCEGDKPKVFRDSLVGNLKEFLDGFASLNVLDDKALAGLVAKARETIKGVDAGDLRENDSIRAHVQARMAEVSQALDGMIIDRPTRKIKITPAKPAASKPEAEPVSESEPQWAKDMDHEAPDFGPSEETDAA